MFKNQRLSLGLGVAAIVAACGGGAVAVTGAAASGSAAAATAGLPPVASGVLAALNAGQTDFTAPPPGASPAVSQSTAVTTALAGAPWGGAATGADLVEAGNRGEPTVFPAKLAWLVSIQPSAPVYRAGGVAPSDGSQRTSPGPAANYFVAVVNATTGQFMYATDGYAPALSSPTAASASHSARRAPGVVICGRRVATGTVGASPILRLTRSSTPVKIGLRSGPRIIMVTSRCSIGAYVRLSHRHVFSITKKIPATRGTGTAAVVLHARRAGSVEMTSTRAGQVIGRMRFVAVSGG
jgi:hypothetical protein